MITPNEITKPERKRSMSIRVKPSTREVLELAGTRKKSTASFIASEILNDWAANFGRKIQAKR